MRLSSPTKRSKKIDLILLRYDNYKMFRRLFAHLRGVSPPPLGRWCLKDKSKNDWKIDTANTDHCGTCAYEETKPLPKIKLHAGSSCLPKETERILKN